MKDQGSFEPKNFEDDIFKMWEDNNAFRATIDKTKKPYCIIMPPPNVTSVAHIGHAMDNTIQDILIRTKRMQGFSTLWQPGTDHAAIATEHKIVEKLAREGKTKEQIGRKEFDKEAWAWYDMYGDRIMQQFKKMGFSADYSRYRFTMDQSSTNAVLEAFVRLYNKGLIYRGSRMTHWCSGCGSAISDEEVEYYDEKSHMWHIRYPFADGSGCIVVATTRPETLFGDMAVAVNPKDRRYKKIVGKMVLLPLTNRQIPIIADDYVEKEFGTGMVKITPAHDPNDYEVGKRHNLKILSVIDKAGNLTKEAGKYAGQNALLARDQIVEDLKSQGLIEKIEDYTHSVGHCQRCHTPIEPLVTEQWFVKMQELAKPAIECVKNGSLKIYAKKFEKNYLHWLENIHDWCISRQLWTGHRIPIFYCDGCGEVFASKEKHMCPKCGSAKVHQDEDVLDTWFSSALWPFSTLGWPNNTAEMDYYYPTSVLVTAYDILLFWVTKMVYMGIECAGNIPFKTTLIHGLVRDEQGRKMSKSLGNGIDPLEVVKDYGADTLRIALVKDMSLGMDTRFSQSKLDNARAFLNKLWNASKFVSLNNEKYNNPKLVLENTNEADKWILNQLNETIKKVTNNIDKYDIGLAVANIVNFLWNDFCDWYIELAKTDLGTQHGQTTTAVLTYVLENSIKLLHPFAPFVTEYIYQQFGHTDLLMLSAFPRYSKRFVFKTEAEEIEQLTELVRVLRNARNEAKIAQNEKITLFSNQQNFKFENYLKKLVKVEEIVFENKTGTIASPLGQFSIKQKDDGKNQEKIQQELKRLMAEIKRSEGMLSNPGFVAKAPQALIDAEKQKLERNTKAYNELKSKGE